MSTITLGPFLLSFATVEAIPAEEAFSLKAAEKVTELKSCQVERWEADTTESKRRAWRQLSRVGLCGLGQTLSPPVQSELL